MFNYEVYKTDQTLAFTASIYLQAGATAAQNMRLALEWALDQPRGTIEFTELDLSGADLSYINIQRRDFTDSDFSTCNFYRAAFTDCHFQSCKFEYMTLRDSILIGSDFFKARFKRVLFTDALIHTVCFDESTFDGCAFNSTEFLNCNVGYMITAGADLSEAIVKPAGKWWRGKLAILKKGYSHA